MPTTIKIYVFGGKHAELLPTMCMFCGAELPEEQFQKVTVQIGNQGLSELRLPICDKDRLSDEILFPDGRNRLLDALEGASTPIIALGAGIAAHAARQKESVETTFTFKDVSRTFERELDRLRHLTPQEYEAMMAAANARFLARLHGHAFETAEEALRRQEKEQQQATDEAAFGLRDAAGTGQVAEEVARSSSKKFLIVTALVGFLSVVLLVCIAASLIGYFKYAREQAEDDVAAKKKAVDPPKEQRAKIKVIDRNEGTIQFLMENGAKQTLRYTESTVFYDRKVNRLPKGVEALHVEDYCVILPTDDRKGLQWLKLANAP